MSDLEDIKRDLFLASAEGEILARAALASIRELEAERDRLRDDMESLLITIGSASDLDEVVNAARAALQTDIGGKVGE